MENKRTLYNELKLTEAGQALKEAARKLLAEKSCRTCVHRIDECNYFNEVGIGCALDKKITSLFDVDKGCKYYE